MQVRQDGFLQHPFSSKVLFAYFVWVSVSHSVVSDSGILRTVALQAPLSMEFSRRDDWSG